MFSFCFCGCETVMHFQRAHCGTTKVNSGQREIKWTLFKSNYSECKAAVFTPCAKGDTLNLDGHSGGKQTADQVKG